MGGFDFEWKGKIYSITTEGGHPCPTDEEEARALAEWRLSEEGIEWFGPVPTDWSKEHYLDDRYPWHLSRLHRIDVDDPDADKEPYINWFDYVECEYGCGKHFYITRGTHTCSYCNGPCCKECAKVKLTKCSTEGCDEWNCNGRGVVAPPSVNGNWGHYQPCNGGNKHKCHNCNRECAHCGESGSDKKMSRCSKCKFSFYCNRDCQKGDYKHHKRNVCMAVEKHQELQKGRFFTRRLNMYE
mmetsp:Transcript_31507/g.46351  ORF Transcript_31507/g.46351 Transcript_31507/m.46351 type:complete len:241 (-) Transcript_31507:57-779(-)